MHTHLQLHKRESIHTHNGKATDLIVELAVHSLPLAVYQFERV